MHDGCGKPTDGRNPLLPDQLLAGLLNGAAHRIERAGQASELIARAFGHSGPVFLACDSGCCFIELFHRFQDAAGQQEAERQAGGDRHCPEEHELPLQHLAVFQHRIETANDQQLADGISLRCSRVLLPITAKSPAIRTVDMLERGGAAAVGGGTIWPLSSRGQSGSDGSSAGGKNEVAGAGALAEIVRDGAVDGKSCDQNVQESRPVSPSRRKRESRPARRGARFATQSPPIVQGIWRLRHGPPAYRFRTSRRRPEKQSRCRSGSVTTNSAVESEVTLDQISAAVSRMVARSLVRKAAPHIGHAAQYRAHRTQRIRPRLPERLVGAKARLDFVLEIVRQHRHRFVLHEPSGDPEQQRDRNRRR